MLPAILAAARVIGSVGARAGSVAISRGASAGSAARSSGALGKVAAKIKRDAPGEIWRHAGGGRVPVADKMFNRWNDKRVSRIDRYNEIKEARAARKTGQQTSQTKSDKPRFEREQKRKQSTQQEQALQKEQAVQKAETHSQANARAVQASQGEQGNSFLERISMDIAQLKDYIFKNGLGGDGNPLKKPTPGAGGGGLISGILSALALGIPALGGSVMGSLGRGVNAIKGIGGKAIDLVKSGGSKVVDAARAVAPRVGSFVESAGGVAKNAFNGLRAGAANVISRGSGMLTSAGEAAAGMLKGGGAVGRVAGTVGRIAGPAAAVAGAGLTGWEAGKWLNEKMAGTKVGEVKNKIFDSIFAGVDQITGGGISDDKDVATQQWRPSALGKFVDGNAAANNDGDRIRQEAEKQKFQREEKIHFDQTQKSNQVLIDAMGANTKATIETVDPLKKISSDDWLSNFMGGVRNAVGKATSWVGDKLKGGAAAVKEAGQKIQEKTAGTGGAVAVKEAGQKIQEKTAGTGGVTEKLGQLAGKATQKVGAGLESVGMKAGDIGYNLQKGSKSQLEIANAFQGGSTINGLSAEQTKAYAGNTAFTESGGKLGITNQYGFAGQYQFGADALADNGIIDKEKLMAAKKAAGRDWYKGGLHKKFMEDSSNWKNEGGREAFLNDKKVQDDLFVKYTNKNVGAGYRSGALTKDSSPEQIAAYAKAAHLKGTGGANDYFLRGKDSADANGMTVSKYAKGAAESMTALSKQVTPVGTATGTQVASATQTPWIVDKTGKGTEVPVSAAPRRASQSTQIADDGLTSASGRGAAKPVPVTTSSKFESKKIASAEQVNSEYEAKAAPKFEPVAVPAKKTKTVKEVEISDNFKDMFEEKDIESIKKYALMDKAAREEMLSMEEANKKRLSKEQDELSAAITPLLDKKQAGTLTEDEKTHLNDLHKKIRANAKAGTESYNTSEKLARAGGLKVTSKEIDDATPLSSNGAEKLAAASQTNVGEIVGEQTMETKKAEQQAAQPIVVVGGGGGAQAPAPAPQGGTANTGSAPMVTRNQDSSIRRVTDGMMSYGMA